MTGREAIGSRVPVASLTTIVEAGGDVGFAGRVIVDVDNDSVGEADTVAEGEAMDETGVRVKTGAEGFVILGSYFMV